ncbi:hypothetical protein ABZ642_40305 [Streptomyces sp. NPDC007157]|uniref:hypothetical protein n=1 Tax=Streptomyces sp. NPDC007157 TaxID=3154681 RepID=UPI0033DDDD42
MTSGNGDDRSGEEPAADAADASPDGRVKDSGDGEGPVADPAPETSADRPPTSRRKPGVEYRPV